MENRDINDRIRESAGEFIAECDHRYRQQAHDAAELVSRLIPARGKVILLAGPSGSSKTTTAKFIGEYLQHYGVRCHIISLDDYYYNFDSGRYPLDEEGKEDLESPLGLDLRLLNRHMDALNDGKEVKIPYFDFRSRKRDRGGARPLQLGPDEAVIFEGINGLNPLITDRNPSAIRVFVAPTTPLTRKGKVLFDCEKIRLLRRMIRDFNYRATTPDLTLNQWASVMRGERLYIAPHAHTADITIDSALGYEVPVLGYLLKPMLETLPEDVPQRQIIDEILQAIPSIAPIAPELVPESSLLRKEFL